MTIAELCAAIDGPVMRRDDPGFFKELQGYNLAVKHNPELVIGATSVEDVQIAVRYAFKHHLPVTVLATGHEAQQPINEGMVITVTRLNSVAVDESTCTAIVGGGARAGDVARAAAPFGLAPVAGGSSSVGFTGLVLGGGIGPLARSHGFCSDYVISFRMVLFNGEEVSASKENNSELFWALRGGKGGLGVIVETRVKLINLNTFYGGCIAFAEEDINMALRKWVDWTHDAPKTVTTSVAIMRFPADCRLPEATRGKTLLMLRFAYPGGAEMGRVFAAPFFKVAEPVFGELKELPGSRLDLVHNDPTAPTMCWTDGMLLDAVDDTFATELLKQVGSGRKSPFLMVEIRHLGAATHIDVPEGSAVSGRSGEYSLCVVGKPDPCLFEKTLPQAFDSLREAIDSYLCTENFINWWSGRRIEDFERCWPESTFNRLVRLRKKWDPSGLFPISPSVS
jgi:FAD linked oxidase domain protein